MYFSGKYRSCLTIKSIHRNCITSHDLPVITVTNEMIYAKDLPSKITLPYLDVGGGDMKLTKYIADFYRIPSSKVIVIDKYEQESIYQYHVIRSDTKWPISDNSVGFITMNMSIHHFEDLNYMISEASRVLRMGGLVYIKEHDILTEDQANIVEQEHQAYMKLNNEPDYGNVYYYSKYGLIKFMQAFGFTVIKSSAPFGENRKYNMLLSKDRPSFDVYYYTADDLKLATRKFIIKEMISYFKRSIEGMDVVDMTAGIGCDIINMMSTSLFKTATAFEMDDDKFQRLRHNIDVSGYKIMMFRADSITVIDRFNAPHYLIYLDPYFDIMTISGLSIPEVMNKAPNSLFIIKSSINYVPNFIYIDKYVTRSIQFFLVRGSDSLM